MKKAKDSRQKTFRCAARGVVTMETPLALANVLSRSHMKELSENRCPFKGGKKKTESYTVTALASLCFEHTLSGFVGSRQRKICSCFVLLFGKSLSVLIDTIAGG